MKTFTEITLDFLINKVKKLKLDNVSNKCKDCDKNCTFFDTRNKKIYNCLPNTDKIIINLYDENLGIDIIFKIIDDITTYLSGEIEMSTKGFSVLYDDNGNVPDRYSIFF